LREPFHFLCKQEPAAQWLPFEVNLSWETLLEEVAFGTLIGYVCAMKRRSRTAPPQEQTTRIHLLVFPHSTPIVPIGLFDILRKSNQIALSMGAERVLEVSLIAVSEKPTVEVAGPLLIPCRYTIRNAPPADWVVVSPMDPEVLDDHSRNQQSVDYLRQCFHQGSDVAAICTGAFLLAQTGLLDGRQAATHWAFQEQFHQRFPNVELRSQEIVMDVGRLVTTGGATSFLNFALYLIERLFGSEVARACSRMFLIDERKAPQGSYAIFSGQKHHGDQGILKAQELMERTVAESLSVEDIASRVSMTRRTFLRRFKQATGGTPSEYLQRTRIEAAKRKLEGTRALIAEIATQVGYEDLTAFRKLFQKHTGLTPTDYRKRYGE
jgi:transcriptional regulator GlxA family with amidase domain